MDVLLDTCTLIWALTDDPRLSKKARDIIGNYDNHIFVSDISLWEIEIKHIKNPSAMLFGSKKVINYIDLSGFDCLPLRCEHLFELSFVHQQGIHNDPFDNYLLAMAKSENMTLLTHDEKVSAYKGIKTIKY